jgi:acylphosphatase
VELVAEGAEEEVRAYAEALRTSQLGSHIRNADVNWSDATEEFRGFEIRH